MSGEFRRADGSAATWAAAWRCWEDGEMRRGGLLRVSEIDVAAKSSAKFSLAEEAELLFRIRASYT